MLFGPADIHPHQHLGPVGGVHSAGTGPDGDDGLALVIFAGEERPDFHRLEVLAQLLELRVGLGQFVVAPFFGGQLVEHREVVEPLPQLLDAAQLTLGVRQLTGDLLGVRLVVPKMRVGRLVLELFDTTAKPLDIEHPLHRGQGGVEGGDIGLTVRIHGSSGYRRRSS